MYVDKQGRFAINKEAVQILESSENVVAVLCIAGLYRTGKSFLMNLLCGRKNAFEVDASVSACTRGLWFFSEPITIEKEGQVYDIYVMDSEGLGGVDKDQNYDVKIFTLSMLLSSFLIYNSVGVIDESALSSLSLVSNITKNVQLTAHSQSKAQDSTRLSEHFPSFLWLLRDFVLELRDENMNPITASQYLESALKEQPGFNEKTEDRNRIRKLIKSFFPNRYCFTLVRPSDDENTL